MHVPFCPYRCLYCDFVAVGAGPKVAAWHERYVEAVAAEAAAWMRRLSPATPPATVFYGGGTPTQLGADRLSALHESLAAHFGLPGDAEVTVECNPGTVDGPGLEMLRRAGCSRLSIGLQATQDRLLALLGRRHTAADAVAAFQQARAAGFDNVNVDLMFGLPEQRLADVLESLDAVCALGPEHVSVYGLQVEPGTPFFAAAARGRLPLPDEDEAAEQFAACRERLASAGFVHYEVSNFARPGRAGRHNRLYWHNADYLGLGIGAHSHWQGWRWSNSTRLSVYTAAVRSEAATLLAPEAPPTDVPWVSGTEAPDARRERSETAFLGLRLLDEGLDERAFTNRFGLSLDEAFPGVVEGLLAEGMLERRPPCVRLAPHAVAIANRVFCRFV